MQHLDYSKLEDIASHLVGQISSENILLWDGIMQDCHRKHMDKRGYDRTPERYGIIKSGLPANASHKQVVSKWIQLCANKCIELNDFCDVLDKYECLDAGLLGILNYNRLHNVPFWERQSSVPSCCVPPTTLGKRSDCKDCSNWQKNYQDSLTCLNDIRTKYQALDTESARKIVELNDRNNELVRENAKLGKQDDTVVKDLKRQIQELQLKNDELAKRNAELERSVCPPKKQIITTDDGHCIYEGLRFMLPKNYDSTKKYDNDWNLLNEKQKLVLASGIGSVLDDIVIQFDISPSKLGINLHEGCTKFDKSKYFVNMISAVGYMNAIQYAIENRVPGIMYRLNIALGL